MPLTMTPDINVLVAAVIQLGEHLVTFDANFKKLLRGAQVTVLVAP